MKAKQKLKKMKKIQKKKKTKFTKFMHLIFGFFYLMIQCAFGIAVINYFTNIKNKNTSKVIYLQLAPVEISNLIIS